MPSAVPARHVIAAAAVLHPTRAASARRFLSRACAGILSDSPLEAFAQRARDWSAQVPATERAALEVLVGQDLLALLPRLEGVARAVSAWADPTTCIAVAAARCRAALSKLDIHVVPSPVHLHDRLPPPYDHASLAMVSLDASDSLHYGLPVGLHVDKRRLWPYVTEATIGHVLVHAALGQKSPELLGRGFEEGACEVLGALHVSCEAIGPTCAEAAFLATRATPTCSPQREQLLGHARGAAAIHELFGMEALASLVRSGRGAIKNAEAALARGRPEDLDLREGPRDEDLSPRLWRTLALRPKPQAVSPQAFLIAQHARAGDDVRSVSKELGIPDEQGRRAAAELTTPAFVALISEQGRVLVEDLGLVLSAGTLRYEA